MKKWAIYACLIMCLMFSSQSFAYWSCAWPHRTTVTVQETTGNTLNNYQVKLTITAASLDAGYSWTVDGFDFRVVNSDDETLMNYWVEDWDQINKTATVWVLFTSLAANSSRDIYLYYGNAFADTLANVPFTFTEPGIKFHTRNTTADPDSLSEAFSIFNAANDTTAGYGCTFITDFTAVNNSGTFGANNNFTAYSETYFEVKAAETGLWGIRYGSDFGDGGGLYVDGIALEEDWLSDLWWQLNWSHSDVLEGTINLTEGYHKLEVIGSEGCCDGGITVQFQKPGGSFTTYNTTNIDIRSRACPINEPTVTFGAHATATCPAAVAEYRFDEGGWSGVGDVIDQSGSFPGTMVGTVSEVDPAKVCIGFEVADNNSGSIIDALVSGVNITDDLGAQGSIAFWINLKDDWNDGTRRKLLDASLLPTNAAAEKYFFIDKQTDGSIQFSFEDDADLDVVLDEPGASVRTKDTWYHITVTFDFINDQFKVYEGETEIINASVATSGGIKDLNYIYFGDKNVASSKGGSVNSANGRFDEINIYNTVISVSEIRGLLANFRDCSDPVLPRACLGSFPNAVNSIKNRVISFGGNAQILENPDNTLSARTINKTSWSSLLTCDTLDCVAGDDEVKDVKPSNFVNKNVSNDETVPFAGSLTIGTTTDEYDVITVNSTGTLDISNSVYTEFFIDKLDVGYQSIVNFEQGTYWIDELNLSSESILTVVDGGPVRLYVKRVIGWSSGVVINSPGAGLQGNTDELLMYFYNDVTMANQTTYSGSIFVTKDINLNQSGNFYGLITGENVTVGLNSQVTYDVNAYYGMTDIDWCESGFEDVDDIVVSAPSNAVNCFPAEISIQLLDKNGDLIPDFEGVITLSTSSGHGDWSVAGVANGVLSNDMADDGLASYGMLEADLGVATFYLSDTHAESTTISIEAQGITQTAVINFQAAGFIFSSVPTQTSGKQSAAITLQAVETDLVTGACAPLLVNTKIVEMAVECLSPNNCGSATANVNGTNISTNILGAVSSFDNVALDFGSSSDSDTSFNFTYDNAGSLRLHAQFELLLDNGSGSGNYLLGSSSGFVVVPAGFCIEPSEANWPCTIVGLTANCSAFKQAGDNFNVVVSAKVYDVSNDYCSVASTTNFAGDVDLTHSLVSPTTVSGGDAGVLSVSSVTLVAAAASFSANISDMGVYTLSAGGNSYLGATLFVNASENIGRFYPKDFAIQSTTSATYSDANGSFTYTGQLESNTDGSIGYTLEPSFNFVVRGFLNQTLKNYLAPLATTPTVTVSALSSQIGSLGSALSVNANFSAGVHTGPDASFEFTYTFNSNDHFSFTRDTNSLIAPFNNDVSIQVTALSEATDGVALANGPVLISGSGGGVYYGRLNIQNAYGPETESVSQRWQMQYYDGTSFILNTLDNTTPYNIADIGVISVSDPGDSGDPLLNTDSLASAPTGATGLFSAGLLNILWSSPANGHFGSYTFPVTTEPWFQYNWNGLGNVDPQGSVTFGQYRGHDRVIYWKEINY